MSFTYPSDDLDNSDAQKAVLGSHWAFFYGGQEQLTSYLFGRAQLERQSLNDAQELFDALSRYTTPIFHTRIWHLLTLRQSDVNGPLTSVIKYGDGVVYGNQPVTGIQYHYGVPHGFSDFAFPLPIGLKGAPSIQNRLSEPSLVWSEGLDYFLDERNNAIVFKQNPFTNDLIPKREVYDGTEVVDYEVGLWIHRGQFEINELHRRWGYVLGIEADSSEHYRLLINAVFDGICQGTARRHIDEALAAICDVPLVRSDDEVVEVITSDTTHTLVITDKYAYQFPLNAVPIVEVGDVLEEGQSLVDTLRIDEFNRGEIPDDLQALAVGKNFLIEGYYGDVIFENQTVPLVVEQDVEGFTKLSFQLGGFAADVEKFFSDLHARGVAAGHTLANLLDVRTEPVDQPGPASLPATINPLQFLIQNILRNNAFLVRMKPDRFGEQALGLQYVRHLRRLIPPHTAMLVLVELTVPTETVILDGQATSEAAGYDESASLFTGMEPVSESVDPEDFIAETVALRHVSGICI